MKFLDAPHIPPPLLKALRSDAYRESLEAHMKDLPASIKGKFTHTMSVTTLARSPRQMQLTMRHSSEIVVNPEERRHSLFGRIGHTMLEEGKGPGEVVEERLGIVYPLMVNGKRVDYYVHGAADLYNYQDGHLSDYKFPKTGSLRYSKFDYHAQLNILGYIWRKNNRLVTKLQNFYLLIKDWDPRYVKDEPKHEYPKSWIVPSEVPMWTDEECVAYLNDRLTKHYLNEHKSDEELDECSDDELWRSEAKFLVYKLEKGEPQKTAKAHAKSMEEAQGHVIALKKEEEAKAREWAAGLKKKTPTETEIMAKVPEYSIKEIPSEPRRCGICEARFFCNQRILQLASQMHLPTEHDNEDL